MMTLSCDAADEMLAMHAVGAGDGDELPPLREHLQGCADCRSLAAQHLATAALLPLALHPMQPDPRLRSRIMAAVHADAAKPAPSGPAAGGLLSRLWNRIPSGRGLTLAGAAAGIAVVAIVGWNTLGTRHATGTGTGSQLQARADVVMDTRNQLTTLKVTDLPPLTTGVYEVWLFGNDGIAHSGGYMGLGPDGRTYTAAMSGDMKSVVDIKVTREPVPASTPTTDPIVDVPIPN